MRLKQDWNRIETGKSRCGRFGRESVSCSEISRRKGFEIRLIRLIGLPAPGAWNPELVQPSPIDSAISSPGLCGKRAPGIRGGFHDAGLVTHSPRHAWNSVECEPERSPGSARLATLLQDKVPAIHVWIGPLSESGQVRAGSQRSSVYMKIFSGADSPPFYRLLKDPFILSIPSSNSTFSQPFEEKRISEVVRNRRIVIFHLWKATLFVLCGVKFLVRLQGIFWGIDHSWEWNG